MNCLVWERHVLHGKTIEAQETQGTLEASRVFLGMGGVLLYWEVFVGRIKEV